MNITFVAGIPGAGKTALLIDLLLREVVPENRPIFIDQRLNPLTQEVGPSIPEFGLTHQVLSDPKTWHEPGVLPDGAVLVVDEAQDIWPVRPNGSKVPAELLAMNRLRHRGITLYLTSQRPAMIDAHIRGLVGRYVLLRDLGVLGRRLYQWFEFPEHPLAFKSAPQQKRYVLPKRVFSLYKSSSMHVRHKRTVPRALVLVGFCLVGLVGLAWYAWQSIGAKTAPKPAAAPVVAAVPEKRALGPSGPAGVAPSPLRVSAPVPRREPYDGFGVHLAGGYEMAGARRYWFALSIAGQVVQVIPEAELLRPGYAYRAYGPCSGVLIWGELERAVRCDAPRAAPPVQPGRALAAGQPASSAAI